MSVRDGGGAPVRVHWVSPIPPARTDIAEYTRRILPDLAARAEVVLWTDAVGWDRDLERHAHVRRFDLAAALPMDFRTLPPAGAATEALFLHMGNSWEFHSGILALARRVPGCVVLHDIAVQEALRDMVFNGLLDRGLYLAEAARWYGEEGRAAGERILAGGGVSPRDLARFPMFEMALSRATAVLAHTPDGEGRAAARDVLPVYRLELPYGIGPRAPAARASDGPLRLVQFGHIGPNRRLEQVFEALGRVAADIDFTFDVFGQLWDPPRLRAAAESAGIAGRVRFRGFAPEPELDAALVRAHLVFNLRDPTMGEASGSQLRIWNASAMAVVTGLGWYASLPAGTVATIPPEDEIPALMRLLRRIDADRSICETVGAAGRARLEAAHGAPLYAEGIVRIAQRLSRDARDRLLSDRARALTARAPDPRLLPPRLAAALG